MRTSQKRLMEMLREVREAIGVRTNREAWLHINKARDYFQKKLAKYDCIGVSLSPYKDNTWTLSGFPPSNNLPVGSCRWSVLYIHNVEDWLDTPHEVLKLFINKAKLNKIAA